MPAAPGFYDLRQVSMSGTNAMSGAGIVEVRSR
jgi:hypothetical protein